MSGLRCSLLIVVLLTTEDAFYSTLYLSEPDLVAQIAELLVPNPAIGDQVTTAAVLVLHAFSHHHSTAAQVLTAVNANIHHGALLSLFRRIAKDLKTGGASAPADLF